jgi:O-antigen ligase
MNFNLISLSKFFLYLVPLVVLVVAPSNFFPFIGGKYYFFRTFVSLSLICVLIYWAFEDKENKIIKDLKEVFSKPLVKITTIFIFIYVLASLFAYDPQAAFWSNFERQEGGFQMIHYWLFFILLNLLFKTKKDWTRLFIVSIIAAVGMIFYGIFSITSPETFFGPYASFMQGTSTPGFWSMLLNKSIRFQGSLGNPAYVAPYLMFIIFYTLYLWWDKKIGVNLRSFWYLFLVLFFTLFFVLSQTRGAFLGLIAGIFAFFIYLILSNKNLRKAGILGLIVLIILGGCAYFYRNSNFIQNLPGSRFLQISFSERTAQTRLWTWESAWNGFKERPILGWGPENFPAVFDKYFNPGHYVINTGSETWFDRAHSVIFDYLAETGILGLLSYLGIYFVFYFMFFRAIKIYNELKNKKNLLKDSPNELQLNLMFSFLIAYFVQNLIIFEVLPMYLNFFLVLAFSNYVFNLFKPQADLKLNKKQ